MPKRQVRDKKDRQFSDDFWGVRPMLIFNILLGPASGWTVRRVFRIFYIINWYTIIKVAFFSHWKGPFCPFKVIHTIKNLFCYVALICNLVQEFNGLVSKGSAESLTLLLWHMFQQNNLEKSGPGILSIFFCIKLHHPF